MNILARFTILSLFCFMTFFTKAALEGWTVFDSTNCMQICEIPDSAFYLNEIANDGDFIGVFCDSVDIFNNDTIEKCVGRMIWNGSVSGLLEIFGDDTTTQIDKEGYYPGEKIRFKF